MIRPRALRWLLICLSMVVGALVGLMWPIADVVAVKESGYATEVRTNSGDPRLPSGMPVDDHATELVVQPGAPQPPAPSADDPQGTYAGLTDEQTLAMPWIPQELRRRLTDAIALGVAANGGDAVSQKRRDEQRAVEPDPRVRQALASGKLPPLGESRMGAPTLPLAVKQAEAGVTKGYWLTPDKSGTYQSTITVDADGRATVETAVEGDTHGNWHVRYSGWAWRDAAGKLIIDGRGQQVDLIKAPGWGGWSPDSMIIGPTGLIDIIDDKRDTGSGSTQRQENG